jgi:hypothetical protein
MKSHGRKITIFMIDGNEFGPRIAEIGNWSGKAIYSPSSTIKQVLERPEFLNSGVYIFKTQSESDDYLDKIYVGETEKLRKRIKKHLYDGRDFTDFIAFISKDDNLTKAHTRYLEAKIISIAKEIKSSEIDNSNAGTESKLPEADESDMLFFLDQIKLILPLMGFRSLIETIVKNPENELEGELNGIPNIKIYTLKHKSLSAKMYESEKGYVVMKGAQCRKKTSNSISEGWTKLRETLVKKEIMVDKIKYFEFLENAIFNSPSAAASVLLGKQAAGPICWVDAKGRTFKENQTV